jgi:hypothetical protein
MGDNQPTSLPDDPSPCTMAAMANPHQAAQHILTHAGQFIAELLQYVEHCLFSHL